MKLYMKCTTDKYELPIAVETSPSLLGYRLGLSAHSVSSMCSRQKSGFHSVEVEDDPPEMWPDNDGHLWFYADNGEVVYVD